MSSQFYVQTEQKGVQPYAAPYFKPNFASMLFSSTSKSSPFAVFSMQAMDRNIERSLKVAAIVYRENSDSKAIKYGSIFTRVAIVSTVAQTVVKAWQTKMKFTSFRQSMRCIPQNAFTAGCFAIVYRIAKDTLESRE